MVGQKISRSDGPESMAKCQPHQRVGGKMIKSWEELSELLADWENRFSLLENSMPNNPEPPIPQKIEITRVSQIVDGVQLGLLRKQLINYIDKKVTQKNTRKVDKQGRGGVDNIKLNSLYASCNLPPDSTPEQAVTNALPKLQIKREDITK